MRQQRQAYKGKTHTVNAAPHQDIRIRISVEAMPNPRRGIAGETYRKASRAYPRDVEDMPAEEKLAGYLYSVGAVARYTRTNRTLLEVWSEACVVERAINNLGDAPPRESHASPRLVPQCLHPIQPRRPPSAPQARTHVWGTRRLFGLFAAIRTQLSETPLKPTTTNTAEDKLGPRFVPALTPPPRFDLSPLSDDASQSGYER